MTDQTLVLFGLTREELFRVSETLTLLIIGLSVIQCVIRPLVTLALENAREAALENRRRMEIAGSVPIPPARSLIVDHSRMPLPKLWIRGLQLYASIAFALGLGIGLGLAIGFRGAFAVLGHH